MAKPKVQIRMFGKFEIMINGEIVLTQLKQSRKTLLLLQYLILKKDRAVTHEELLDALWNDAESTNPSTALRTMLHRFRALVKECGYKELENCIVTNRGAYQWNPQLECSIDVFELEKYAQDSTNERATRKQKTDSYNKIISLYVGALLPGSAGEMWVMPKSVYCHDIYMDSVMGLIELLKESEEYNNVVHVCRQAMDVDLYDERLHMELMLALIKLGKNREALSQYYYTTNFQYKQLGVQPSGEIRAIYKQILAADKQMENDIDDIQRNIEHNDEDKGAFICEYEIFKDIYQLQRRMLVRYNSTMFIALISLGRSDDKQMEPGVLDSWMWKLLDILKKELRRGDTISRYSASQFVMLLPEVSYDTGNSVLERVKKAFFETHSRGDLMLNYKLRPLNVSGTNDFPKKKK